MKVSDFINKSIIYWECNFDMLQPEHNASYFAVFDGHVGIDAAKYASTHLHVNLVHHPSYPTDMETALRDAIKITDQNFLRRAKHEVGFK